jgi:hypothetical protein
MTDLVLPGTPGRSVFVRQRRVEEPPFTNCRLVVLVQQLIRAGVRIPDKARFIARLRRLTGVPEIGPDGAQGTSAADVIRAMAILMPWVPVEARLWDDAELLEAIAADLVAVAVAVDVYNSLPGNLDRWSPRFDGGHMIGVPGARPASADPKVLWSDPLGLGRYRGEWVSWSRVKPHLSQAGGRVFATTIPIGAAMSTSVVLSRVLPAGSVVVLHKGVATFRYDDEALTFVEDKPTTRNLKPLADTVVTVDQQPRGKGRPIGRFVRVAAGGLEGRYVRLRDIEIRQPVPGDPVDVDAIVAAAVAQARLETEAEVRGEYSLVDEPLFRQAVPA